MIGVPPRRLSGAAAACIAALFLLAPAGRGAAAAVPASFPAPCTIRAPVYVAGGTPAGVAAAVSAARLGDPVVMTEARPYLGGDLTGPMVNVFDMDYGPDGQQLAQGVFLEVYRKLGIAFDVEKAKRVFLHEVRREPLITLRLHTRPVAVLVRGPWITGVVVQDTVTGEEATICARRIVDATDDADIAAMAGVPYELGRQGSGVDRAMMSATLVFELGGVSWRQVVAYISGIHNRSLLRGTGIYRGNVWGYRSLMSMYHPAEPGVAIYDLNIGLQDGGSVLINGLLIFGVDGTDPASVADGLRRGRAELPHLVAFLREMAPGFAQADLIRSADYLYIRETRHIRGLYTLTAQDIVASRVFWDAVGVASYPIDLHPYHLGEFNPYAARRYVYTIPFRSLVPVGVGNLVCASRSISASYEAAGSARVVPTTMEEGQAAGTAAVLSIQDRVSFRQFAHRPMLVHALQGLLHVEGAYLLPETLASTGRAPQMWPKRPYPPTPVARGSARP